MSWVAHDIQDQVVDFVRHWSQRTELLTKRLLGWADLGSRKYVRWQERYGKANEHNGLVPHDHWLEDWEKLSITDFAGKYPLEGYRRLAFMMLDADVVAVSPSSVYRVLKEAGLLPSLWQKPTRKGTGFVQPLQPHEHWHSDFSYVNIGGGIYYLCSILDGTSRFIVHWEIRKAIEGSRRLKSCCKKRGKNIRRPGPGSSATTARSSSPWNSRNSSGCGRPATCSPTRITRKATENWAAGIARSKSRPSGPKHPRAWNKRAPW